MSAALAAVPVLPELTAATAADSGPSAAVNGQDPVLNAAAQRILLEEGSQGGLVASAQRRLNEVLPVTHIAVDGIFGPQTKGAVQEFQRREGMSGSGMVDARTWSFLFKAPVLVFGGPAAAGATSDGTASGSTSVPSQSPARTTRRAGGASGTTILAHAARAAAVHVGGPGGSATDVSDTSGSSDAAATSGSPAPSNDAPSSNPGPSGSGHGHSGSSNGSHGSAPPVAVVAPSSPPSQSSTYVLTGGVALPLPRQYLVNGSVDQGVDYAAPGGTPLYAMGDGVIIGEGISGFGPNAPALKITSGPLKGLQVYYGHSGPDLVHVGDHVHAGQQISIIGYGIVGISTGPHLEVGFYPPGPMGSGSRMLSVLNSMLSQHPAGRAWGSNGTVLARTTRARTAVIHGKRKKGRSRDRSSVSHTGSGGVSAAESIATPAAPLELGSSAVAASAPAATTDAAAPTADGSAALSVPKGAEIPAAAAPADGVAQETPLADTGKSTAPADTSESTPPADTSGNTAPADTGGSTAPADTVESTAPASTVDSTAPSDPSPASSGESQASGTDVSGTSSPTSVGSAGTATSTPGDSQPAESNVTQPPAPKEAIQPSVDAGTAQQQTDSSAKGEAPSAAGEATSASGAGPAHTAAAASSAGAAHSSAASAR